MSTMMTIAQERFLRDELIPALRSGEYRQGFGALRVAPEGRPEAPHYCCLGVACNLIDSTAWMSRVPNPDADEYLNEPEVVDVIDDIAKASTIAHDRNDKYELVAFAWHDPEFEDYKSGTLPRSVQHRAGLTNTGTWRIMREIDDPVFADAPRAVTRHPGRSLVEMNDSGASFADIADVIEWILDHPEAARFHQNIMATPGMPESALVATN